MNLLKKIMTAALAATIVLAPAVTPAHAGWFLPSMSELAERHEAKVNGYDPDKIEMENYIYGTNSMEMNRRLNEGLNSADPETRATARRIDDMMHGGNPYGVPAAPEAPKAAHRPLTRHEELVRRYPMGIPPGMDVS